MPGWYDLSRGQVAHFKIQHSPSQVILRDLPETQRQPGVPREEGSPWGLGPLTLSTPRGPVTTWPLADKASSSAVSCWGASG